MRHVIVCVGRRKLGPEADLFSHYQSRLSAPLNLVTVEEKKALAGDALKRAEARLLTAKIPDGAAIIALDERGKHLSSEGFAGRLKAWEEDGIRDVAFLIGGADGLDGALRTRANLVMALGTLTWPHQLVPALLAEQLYRAQCILSGHPYHRA